VTPHTLRHSFATPHARRRRRSAGGSEAAGHANISTTQVYTHVSRDRCARCTTKRTQGQDNDETLHLRAIPEVAAVVRQRPPAAAVGLILGSGLNALADEMQDAIGIPYADIPYYGQTSVAEPPGPDRDRTAGRPGVFILQGRIHAYEGFPAAGDPAGAVMHELGIRLSSSPTRQGHQSSYRAGDLMLIQDHIGLMAMTGGNPLWGPTMIPGAAISSHEQSYDPALRRLALKVPRSWGSHCVRASTSDSAALASRRGRSAVLTHDRR